jgi:peptide-methionine (S)-S-oxide reductase
MFEFLKKLMTNNKSVSANKTNSLHRILGTDIKEVPKSQEDEIIFGCGCFWGA